MNTLLLRDRTAPLALAEAIQSGLVGAGHTVTHAFPNDNEIKPCAGCFRCWTHTPGLCVQTKDPGNEMARLEIQADAVLILTQITYGGYSADIKAFLDRSIPNILPLFDVYRGEMHHKPRYARFPIWIGVGYGGYNEEERQTFEKLMERNALNMRPVRYRAIFAEPDRDIETAVREVLKILEDVL